MRNEKEKRVMVKCAIIVEPVYGYRGFCIWEFKKIKEETGVAIRTQADPALSPNR